MKKVSTMIVFVLMVSMAFSPLLGSADASIVNTIYVDDDNTSGPWDGSLAYPYQHIQEGLNASSDGDTVFIFNGTYTELLTIDAEVVLIGEDNSATIIQDIIQDAYSDAKLLTISADNVTVENLCIRQHNNTNFQHNLKGIYCTGSDGVLIQQNHIINCSWGIRFKSSSGEILDNHLMHGQGTGRTAVTFENPTQESELIISNNSIINYGYGIFFDCRTSAPSQMLINYNYMESSVDEDVTSSCGIRLYIYPGQNYQMHVSHNVITGFLTGLSYKDLWSGAPILEDTLVDIVSNSFNNIENDLLLSSGPLRSDEKLMISKNNFFGQNNKILFLEGIILGPTLPLRDMIFKSFFEWSQNYWANHSVNGPVLVPGRLVLTLSTTFPGYGLKLPIFQTDPEPADEPFEV